MSLRVKTLAVIGLMLVVFLALLYFLIRGVLFSDLQEQEDHAARKLLGQISKHLEEEGRSLALAMTGWSSWDDTYEFMAGQDPAYLSRYLNDETFSNSSLELFLCYTLQNELACAKSWDYATKTEPDISPETITRLGQVAQVVDQRELRGYRAGLVNTKGGVLLVAARPILRSDDTGPGRGTLVVAKHLTKEYLSELDWLTSSSTQLSGLDHGSIEPQIISELTMIGIGGIALRPQAKTLDAYMLLADVTGKPSIVLALSSPQELLARGIQLERLILLGLCILMALFAVVMLAHIEATVLRPLSRLSRNAGVIGAAGDLGRRLPVAGQDELAKLAQSLNGMLDSLARAEDVLRESEERYRFFYNHTPVMLHSIDSQGLLVSVSDYWLDMLGYTREEVLGRPSTDFLTQLSRQHAKTVAMPQFLELGILRDVPLQMVRKDGSVMDVLLSAVAEHDAQGQFVRSLAVMVDITGSKRAEEEKRRQADEIKAITAAFPDLYFRTDAQGRYLDFLGGRVEDLFVPPAQLLGKTIWEVLPPTIAKTIQDAIQRALAEGVLVSVEYSLFIAGKGQTFEARLVPLQHEELLTVVRNITQNKRAAVVSDVLLRITEAVTTAESLYSLLETVHMQLIRLIQADNFYVALYDASREIYEFPYVVDQRDRSFDPQQMPHSLTDYVRRTGKPLLASVEAIERMRQAGEVEPLGPLPLSWIGAPLNTAQGSIGVVVVQSYGEEALYVEDDLELLAVISGDIAMAIERRRAQDALLASEERYRSFVSQSSEGIWRFEFSEPPRADMPEEELLTAYFEKAYLAECNDAMARMYGFEQADEFIGIPLGVILPLSDERNYESLRTFIRHGYRIQDAETCELDREGQPHVFLNNMLGIIEEGKLIRVWGMQRDITERRRAEDALRASEEYLRLVIDLVPHFIFAKDSAGRFILVNQAIAEAYGTTVQDLTGRVDADFSATPEEAAHFFQDDLQVIRSGMAKLIPEETITDATGRKRLLQTTKIPFTATGQPALLGISIDITERKRAEEALLEREESYRRLVELAQESIVTVDMDERITFCNPAFVGTLGYTAQELLGRSLLTLADEPSKPVLARGTQLRQSGAASTYEVVLLAKSGEKKTFLIAASPLYDRNGGYEGALGVMTDMTERKRAEQALAYAQKLESLGVLAGGIAHDFNNLLVGVMGNAGLALRELSPSAAARHYIQDIETASQRAADLTRQMLAYSGKGQLIIHALDLSDAVEEITRLLEAAIPRNVVLKYNLRRDLPAVEADPVQIRQVAMNLILNAAEAIGGASGIVSVTTGAVEADATYLTTAYLHDELPEGLYVYLEVGDTGCGMDAATKERIFDPFFTTKFAGRGLGLAAVLGIVRAHQGSIKVYTEPGRGSTFKVLLPASPELVVPRSVEALEDRAWSGSGTILVVDDEPTVRVVAKRVLEQQGFKVLLAVDGQEGVELYREAESDIVLVLLDMTMPRLSGEEAYREMRLVRADVCVVLSSGYNEQDATMRFAGKGLAGFLQKPYSPAELLALVHAVLHADGGASQADAGV